MNHTPELPSVTINGARGDMDVYIIYMPLKLQKIKLSHSTFTLAFIYFLSKGIDFTAIDTKENIYLYYLLYKNVVPFFLQNQYVFVLIKC